MQSGHWRLFCRRTLSFLQNHRGVSLSEPLGRGQESMLGARPEPPHAVPGVCGVCNGTGFRYRSHNQAKAPRGEVWPDTATTPPVVWQTDPDQRPSAQIQSSWAQGTSTRHFRPPASLEEMEVGFVIALQVGCVADNSCHDPYGGAVTPPGNAANASPVRLLRAIAVNQANEFMQLSLCQIRPHPRLFARAGESQMMIVVFT